MYFKWDDSLTVGHPVIDAEHQKLVEMINRLNSAMVSGHDREALGEILCDLSEYCSYHFDHEEREMQRIFYPDYERHKALHDNLLQRLSELVYAFEAGRGNVSAEMMEFLRQWLSVHIRIEDTKLARVLVAKAETV